MKLKHLINKRLIVNYTTKSGDINDQQGRITHEGQFVIGLNIGKKEIFIDKSRINSIKDMKGNYYYKN